MMRRWEKRDLTRFSMRSITSCTHVMPMTAAWGAGVGGGEDGG